MVVHDRSPVRQRVAGRRIPGCARPTPGAGRDRLAAIPNRDRGDSCAGRAARHRRRSVAGRVRAVIDAIRTPGELLDGLPEFPFVSSYRDWDGLRLAHLDEGEGPAVVFLHGEP